MKPVAIGRFNYYIIRFTHSLWIFDDRLIDISDIPRKYNLLLHIVFTHPNFDTRRAEQMSHICKPYPYALAKLNFLIVIARYKILQCIDSIFHRVQWLIKFCTRSSRLSISPLSLKLLNMGTVTEHDLTEVCCRKGRYDLPLKSSLGKQRNQTGMINVCMRQKYIVNLPDGNRNLLILIEIWALLHTTVDQNVFSIDFQKMAASGHFMCCTDKCKFHMQVSFLIAAVPRCIFFV